MPLGVEAVLPHGFTIGQIQRLLDDKRSEHGIKLFGRSAAGLVEKFGNFANRDRRQDVLSKKTGGGPQNLDNVLSSRSVQTERS